MGLDLADPMHQVPSPTNREDVFRTGRKRHLSIDLESSDHSVLVRTFPVSINPGLRSSWRLGTSMSPRRTETTS